jgi:hypothetical protein
MRWIALAHRLRPVLLETGAVLPAPDRARGGTADSNGNALARAGVTRRKLDRDAGLDVVLWDHVDVRIGIMRHAERVP